MNPGEKLTLDCRKCGACCATTRRFIEEYGRPRVALSSQDHRRLPPKYQSKVVSSGGERVLPLKKLKVFQEGLVCTAFEGKPGKEAVCTVYAQRPEQCRSFAVGSDACHDARFHVLGIELPLVDTQEVMS